ncbi:hypothetical protein POM88_003175 [Heracleum sosnowskyi]|uniref:Uncharacterized protein n=1 Tax=Heracleum sosnowskyi TaxID=360622 RepID=A0AAD8JK52_9APIA|nr:hypothetical protein POM88_003175 [Heracleum sosnowskyi]
MSSQPLVYWLRCLLDFLHIEVISIFCVRLGISGFLALRETMVSLMKIIRDYKRRELNKCIASPSCPDTLLSNTTEWQWPKKVKLYVEDTYLDFGMLSVVAVMGTTEDTDQRLIECSLRDAIILKNQY